MTARRTLGLIVAFALIVGASYLGRSLFSSDPEPTDLATQPEVDLTELNRTITVLAERAPERGESLEYRRLGDLYVTKADITGDLGDYRQAITAFQSAVAINPTGVEDRFSLASTLLTLHEFKKADELVQQLVAEDPENPEILALAGDTALERGDLAAARVHYDALAALVADDPAVTVRLANLAYVTGQPAVAQSLAAEVVDRAASLPDEEMAFFHSFAGSVGFLTGDLDSAEFHHQAAAALTPGDQGALGELARVRAAVGEYDSAIELLEQANEIQPEPDHLTRLADLYAITGTASDETIQRLFDEGTDLATQDADYSRAWARLHAQFLLDHERDLDEALRIAERDLEQRQDAGAWDLYAWALFHQGRFDEARAASDKALGTGVVNAAYLYHAGSISAALGEPERAASELRLALDLNPGFEPVHGAKAEALLADVGG